MDHREPHPLAPTRRIAEHPLLEQLQPERAEGGRRERARELTEARVGLFGQREREHVEHRLDRVGPEDLVGITQPYRR